MVTETFNAGYDPEGAVPLMLLRSMVYFWPFEEDTACVLFPSDVKVPCFAYPRSKRYVAV
ncbi:MAG: hypothetical protein C3F06_03690 [Candidatus Methanoperedenaceae archaeon]|nr:MAG: hypothetical protein C3F06_03690 [Candidatus Methanoperedenaceae archaeon]